MKAKRNQRIFAPFFALAILLLVSLACGKTITPPSLANSPDGRFQAQFVRAPDSIKSAYQVIEISTGKVVLITYAEYRDTPNDVKAAIFSDDSKKFAAAYHYSHNGGYTWVGVWSIETGEFLYSKKMEGYQTSLGGVFDE